MKAHAGTVIVCDDETGFRGMIADVLRDEGHQVFATATLEQGRQMLAEVTPDLLILDLRLPDGDGLDLLRELPELAPDCTCLIVTAHASIGSAVDALRLGVHDYLEKPVRIEDLVAKVNLLLTHCAVLRENAILRTMVGRTSMRGEVVTQSKAMAALVKQAERVAERGRVALITGESGVGKEVIARFIHKRSSDREGPFVPVNLAALPDSIAEAQLFGHVRGAFTGANQASEGLARAAAGGTLLLDEITDATLSIQAKLLRLVDHSEVLPVGATQPVKAHFRLLAATNRDIVSEVEAGGFREDLFHRLNVVRLHVPPLRDRREDLPRLIQILLNALAAERGMVPPTVTKECLRTFDAYHWPGNVRELRNVLERAVILGSGAEVGRDDLPEEVRNSDTGDASTPSDLRRAVISFERAHIKKVLDAAGGDRRTTASMLGISLATLYRKLDEGGSKK